MKRGYERVRGVEGVLIDGSRGCGRGVYAVILPFWIDS